MEREERDALKWAAEALQDPDAAIICDGKRADALVSLRYPESAASVIDRLLSALGVHACGHPYPGWPDMTCDRMRGHTTPHSNIVGDDDEYEFVSGASCVEECDVPTLVLLLLAILDGPENASDAFSARFKTLDVSTANPFKDFEVAAMVWLWATEKGVFVGVHEQRDDAYHGRAREPKELGLLAIRLAAVTTVDEALAALRIG